MLGIVNFSGRAIHQIQIQQPILVVVNPATPEPIVSIRYFSGEAALSCWNVIPDDCVTSTNSTLVAVERFCQSMRSKCERRSHDFQKLSSRNVVRPFHQMRS